MPSPAPILDWLADLSDPIRARLLRVLERQELAVAEVCEVMQLPQSTVSRHLKLLSDDGWITSRREGTSRLYCTSFEEHGPAARKLWALLREQLSASDTARHDDQRLEQVLAERELQSQAFFASSAGQWDKLREELFGQGFDLRALAALLDERWTLADLGCGTGGLAQALAPFVARIVAVDSSAAMLQAARRRLKGASNVEVRRGQMEALPLEDGALDAALAVLVLHHLPAPQRALAEVARALKPGGRALVVDMQPHERAEYRQQMGHQWQGFSREQLEGWAGEAGLGALRWTALPPDPAARGPALFVFTARKPHAGSTVSP